MQIRHTISARLDGEAGDVDEAELYAHLAACGDCRTFAQGAERLHRAVRLAPAPAIPDLTPEILTAIGAESRRTDGDTRRVLQWMLVAIALAQIAVAIPALLFGADAGLPIHTARHIGSFDVALAVGFLYAAWRPSRVPGLLPVVTALVVCLVGSSFLDVAAGNTGALGEAHHLTDFAGLVVVWLLSRPALPVVRIA